jgi:uncharacterized membrane protein YhhN
MAYLGIALTAVGLVFLLGGFVAGRPKVGWVAKPLASTGFLVAAAGFGAFESAYGWTIFVGLVLCFAGDVLLIPTESRKAFTGGLGAFLLGHVAFGVAFAGLGLSLPFTAGAAAVIVGVFLGIARWLKPHVPEKLRIPVRAYLVVIGAMVALAAGAFGGGATAVIPVAAVAFAASDVAVARHRFVRPGVVNKLWGLPLYYAAVVAIASTVASV